MTPTGKQKHHAGGKRQSGLFEHHCLHQWNNDCIQRGSDRNLRRYHALTNEQCCQKRTASRQRVRWAQTALVFVTSWSAETRRTVPVNQAPLILRNWVTLCSGSYGLHGDCVHFIAPAKSRCTALVRPCGQSGLANRDAITC